MAIAHNRVSFLVFCPSKTKYTDVVIIGVPVATVGINNSINAALLAARIIGAFDPDVQRKVKEYAEDARKENMDMKNVKMQDLGWEKYFNQM